MCSLLAAYSGGIYHFPLLYFGFFVCMGFQFYHFTGLLFFSKIAGKDGGNLTKNRFPQYGFAPFSSRRRHRPRCRRRRQKQIKWKIDVAVVISLGRPRRLNKTVKKKIRQVAWLPARWVLATWTATGNPEKNLRRLPKGVLRLFLDSGTWLKCEITGW